MMQTLIYGVEIAFALVVLLLAYAHFDMWVELIKDWRREAWHTDEFHAVENEATEKMSVLR